MRKFLLRLKANHQRPFGVREGTALEPGGYCDSDTVMGNVRSGIMCLLAIYCGRYLDLWLGFHDVLFGNPVTLPSQWRMQYHSRIVYAMGVIGLLSVVVLIAKRTRPQNKEVAEDAVVASAPPAAHSLRVEQRLRDLIAHFPVLHDLIWGWPFLLGVSLVFFGKTADGSAVPGLSGIFVPPSLDFFVLGKTPVSALNGLLVGSIAYAINHAIAKTDRLHLATKLMISLTVGALAIWAWYALTVAMGAPI